MYRWYMLYKGSMNPTPQEIKQARLDADLSQAKAAMSVKVSTTTWRRWEYGDRKMSEGYWDLFNIRAQDQLKNA